MSAKPDMLDVIKYVQPAPRRPSEFDLCKEEAIDLYGDLETAIRVGVYQDPNAFWQCKTTINPSVQNEVDIEGTLLDYPVFVTTETGRKLVVFKIAYGQLNKRDKKAYYNGRNFDESFRETQNILNVVADENDADIHSLKERLLLGDAIVRCSGGRLKYRPYLHEDIRSFWSFDKLENQPEKREEIKDFLTNSRHAYIDLSQGKVMCRNNEDSQARKKKASGLDAQTKNDIAEFYDRIANLTDYSLHYNRRLKQPVYGDMSSSKDYCDLIYQFNLNYDDLKHMYDSMQDEDCLHVGEIEGEFSRCEGIVAINCLAGLNMKSFKPSSAPLRSNRKKIADIFSGRQQQSQSKTKFRAPYVFRGFYRDFCNNFQPEEKQPVTTSVYITTADDYDMPF